MSIKFRSRVFRKPFHWNEERYEKTLKNKNLFKTREELEKSFNTNNKSEDTNGRKI